MPAHCLAALHRILASAERNADSLSVTDRLAVSAVLKYLQTRVMLCLPGQLTLHNVSNNKPLVDTDCLLLVRN